jgi:hypothetical protein
MIDRSVIKQEQSNGTLALFGTRMFFLAEMITV